MKPIKNVYIYFPGEKTAGLNSMFFVAEVFIDPNCIAGDQVSEWLEEIRQAFQLAYQSFSDCVPQVQFDFEFKNEKI